LTVRNAEVAANAKFVALLNKVANDKKQSIVFLMRSDSLSEVPGRITFPASSIAGRPAAPVVATAGRHVRPSTSSTRSRSRAA